MIQPVPHRERTDVTYVAVSAHELLDTVDKWLTCFERVSGISQWQCDRDNVRWSLLTAASLLSLVVATPYEAAFLAAIEETGATKETLHTWCRQVHAYLHSTE